MQVNTQGQKEAGISTHETSGFFRARRLRYSMLMVAPPPMKMKRGMSWQKGKKEPRKSRCISGTTKHPLVLTLVHALLQHIWALNHSLTYKASNNSVIILFLMILLYSTNAGTNQSCAYEDKRVIKRNWVVIEEASMSSNG